MADVKNLDSRFASFPFSDNSSITLEQTMVPGNLTEAAYTVYMLCVAHARFLWLLL